MRKNITIVGGWKFQVEESLWYRQTRNMGLSMNAGSFTATFVDICAFSKNKIIIFFFYVSLFSHLYYLHIYVVMCNSPMLKLTS
jgi:hypothetical protein